MKRIQVGFCGLGTVGAGALHALIEGAERIERQVGCPVVATRAAVRDLSRARQVDTAALTLTTDPLAVAAADDIDIVVEVIGGVTVAREVVEAALRAGKAVVTANKELIAKHGLELFAIAREHHGQLAFEASVAGGIPIIAPLRQSLAGNQIQRLMGIINGTTNYMLTEMSRTGAPFDQLLAEAQAAGYAEADPTADVDGHDAAYKLAILAMLAFDTPVAEEDVARSGIRPVEPADIAVAERLGYTIKLLAQADDTPDGLELRVHPTLVPLSHPLAAVGDVFNAIFVEGSSVGQVMFYGRGAGFGPTGSAVVGDVIEVARALVHGGRLNPPALTEPRPVVSPEQTRSCYYVRMRVKDQPGVLASLADILGREQVSIAQMIQTTANGGLAEIVWITHLASDASLQLSLRRMGELETVEAVCNVLRCLAG